MSLYVTKVPNLYWSNYTVDVPSKLITIDQFTKYSRDRIKVDWSDEPVLGQIKLHGSYNYALFNNFYYFLEPIQSYGRGWQLYRIIYDVWTNEFLLKKLSVTGTIDKTNNKDLVRKYIHTTKPLITNPNKKRIIPIEVGKEDQKMELNLSTTALREDAANVLMYLPEHFTKFGLLAMQYIGKPINEEELEIPLLLLPSVLETWPLNLARRVAKWIYENQNSLKVFDINPGSVGTVNRLTEILNSKIGPGVKRYAITTDESKIFANTHDSSKYVKKIDFSGFTGIECLEYVSCPEIKDRKVSDIKGIRTIDLSPELYKDYVYKRHTKKQVLIDKESGKQYEPKKFVLGEIFAFWHDKEKQQNPGKYVLFKNWSAQNSGEALVVSGLKSLPTQEEFPIKETQEDWLKANRDFTSIHINEKEILIPHEIRVLAKKDSGPLKEGRDPREDIEHSIGINLLGLPEDHSAYVYDDWFETEGIALVPDYKSKSYFLGYIQHKEIETTGVTRLSDSRKLRYSLITPISYTGDANPEYAKAANTPNDAPKEFLEPFATFLELNLSSVMLGGILYPFFYKIQASFPEAMYEREAHLISVNRSFKGYNPTTNLQDCFTGSKKDYQTVYEVSEAVLLNRHGVSEYSSKDKCAYKRNKVCSKLFWDWVTDWDNKGQKWSRVYITPGNACSSASWGSQNQLGLFGFTLWKKYKDKWYHFCVVMNTRRSARAMYEKAKVKPGESFTYYPGDLNSWEIHFPYFSGTNNNIDAMGMIGTSTDATIDSWFKEWPYFYAFLKLLHEFKYKDLFERPTPWFIASDVQGLKKDFNPFASLIMGPAAWWGTWPERISRGLDKSNPEMSTVFPRYSYPYKPVEIANKAKEDIKSFIKSHPVLVYLDETYKGIDITKTNLPSLSKATYLKWFSPEEDMKPNDVFFFDLRGTEFILVIRKRGQDIIDFELITKNSKDIIGVLEHKQLLAKTLIAVDDVPSVVNQVNTLYVFGHKFPLKFRDFFSSSVYTFKKFLVQSLDPEGESEFEYRRVLLETKEDVIDECISTIKKKSTTKVVDPLRWEELKFALTNEQRQKSWDNLRLTRERERFYIDEGYQLQDILYERRRVLPAKADIANRSWWLQALSPITGGLSGTLSGMAMMSGGTPNPLGIAGVGLSTASGVVGGFMSANLAWDQFLLQQDIEKRNNQNQERNLFETSRRFTEDYSLRRDEMNHLHYMQKYSLAREITRVSSSVNIAQTNDAAIHSAYNKLLTDSDQDLNIYLINQYPEGELLEYLHDYYETHGYDVFIKDQTLELSSVKGNIRFIKIDSLDISNISIRNEAIRRLYTGLRVRD